MITSTKETKAFEFNAYAKEFSLNLNNSKNQLKENTENNIIQDEVIPK